MDEKIEYEIACRNCDNLVCVPKGEIVICPYCSQKIDENGNIVS